MRIAAFGFVCGMSILGDNVTGKRRHVQMNRMTSLLTLLAALAFALSPLLSSGFNGFAPDQFPVPQDNPPVQHAWHSGSGPVARG